MSPKNILLDCGASGDVKDDVDDGGDNEVDSAGNDDNPLGGTNVMSVDHVVEGGGEVDDYDEDDVEDDGEDNDDEVHDDADDGNGADGPDDDDDDDVVVVGDKSKEKRKRRKRRRRYSGATSISASTTDPGRKLSLERTDLPYSAKRKLNSMLPEHIATLSADNLATTPIRTPCDNKSLEAAFEMISRIKILFKSSDGQSKYTQFPHFISGELCDHISTDVRQFSEDTFSNTSNRLEIKPGFRSYRDFDRLTEKSKLPPSLKSLDESIRTLNFQLKLFVRGPTVIRSKPGGERQKWHCDYPFTDVALSTSKKSLIMFVAIMDGTYIWDEATDTAIHIPKGAFYFVS